MSNDILQIEASTQLAQGPKHMVELQSFRGIAALIVLLHHCSFDYTYDQHLRPISERLLNAHAAVVAFYVLSGYVLSLALSQQSMTTSVVGAFYIRPIARIYPALWIASSLALLYVIASHTSVFGHLTAQQWVTQYRDRTMSVPKVVASYLGIGTVLPIPTWSIFAELLGSAIVPLILLSMRRGPLFLAAFAIALLLISLTIGEKTRMFAGVYLVSFVFGASILQWQARFSVLLATNSYTRAVALVALVFLLFIRQIGPWSFEFELSRSSTSDSGRTIGDGIDRCNRRQTCCFYNLEVAHTCMVRRYFLQLVSLTCTCDPFYCRDRWSSAGFEHLQWRSVDGNDCDDGLHACHKRCLSSRRLSICRNTGDARRYENQQSLHIKGVESSAQISSIRGMVPGCRTRDTALVHISMFPRIVGVY